MATEDLCVCCGMPIPEGKHVCWTCENKLWRGEMYNAAIRTVNNERIHKSGTLEQVSAWIKSAMQQADISEVSIRKV